MIHLKLIFEQDKYVIMDIRPVRLPIIFIPRHDRILYIKKLYPYGMNLQQIILEASCGNGAVAAIVLDGNWKETVPYDRTCVQYI